MMSAKTGDMQLRPLAPSTKVGLWPPTTHIRTYQQTPAQYNLHPEDKFLNGDFLDRGTIIRRHVSLAEIEYIAKEATNGSTTSFWLRSRPREPW
jgi:hypothetical protein